MVVPGEIMLETCIMGTTIGVRRFFPWLDSEKLLNVSLKIKTTRNLGILPFKFTEISVYVHIFFIISRYLSIKFSITSIKVTMAGLFFA